MLSDSRDHCVDTEASRHILTLLSLEYPSLTSVILGYRDDRRRPRKTEA